MAESGWVECRLRDPAGGSLSRLGRVPGTIDDFTRAFAHARELAGRHPLDLGTLAALGPSRAVSGPYPGENGERGLPIETVIKKTNLRVQRLSKRMMGLEPTTFYMANVQPAYPALFVAYDGLRAFPPGRSLGFR